MRFGFLWLFIFNSVFTTAQGTRYQVIIDEFLADPAPLVLAAGGLPESEYAELKNISTVSIDLFNWKLSDQTSSATISVHFILKPDSFVVICPNAYLPAFLMHGSAIGVSNFPSLDNTRDIIMLRSKEGNIIYALEYADDWFENAVKKQGGWSLEMIDPGNYCSAQGNWAASTDRKGGSPGRINSVNGSNPDKEPPRLLRSYASDSIHLVCIFNEPLDSGLAFRPENFEFSPAGISLLSVSPVQPFFNRAMLILSKPLPVNETIKLTVRNVRDCAGNNFGVAESVKSGRAGYPDSVSLAISEMLFNPVSPGVDYIEVYNYGSSIVDLKEILLANRSSSGVLGSVKILSDEPWLLFPGEYCLLTESIDWVSRQFTVMNPSALIQLTSFPSYPDDAGTVVITNTRGRIIEEVTYSEKWHFKLISNTEGVSLERISPAKPARDPSNWHSASGSSGYGTPGYLNSQSGLTEITEGVVSIQPRIFSPDNDGIDDFLTLNYRFPDPGYVCNVTAYDISGKVIRMLARNLLCGKEGYIRWDGLDQANAKVASGIYLIITDVFSLKGKTERIRNTVVVGSR